jgi:bifunctional UDP-N-acetylglucosamine pyrophosphorylase / glucosamine-1-phosphate N-acetyltransferase
MKPTVAVVLAAGKGTRMKSALPKVLHEACGQPLLTWVVDSVHQAGINDVVVVTGHGSDAVRAMLQQRYGARVRTVLQAEQRGTGHAAQMALPAIGDCDDVLLVYGDTPLLTPASLQRLLQARREQDAAVALWTTTMAQPHGYGRIVREGNQVVAIAEQRDATPAQQQITEVNPGVYCVRASFLGSALGQLQPQNAQGEYYLTDLIMLANAARERVVGVGVDVQETDGINDRVQLAAASKLLRTRIVRHHQRAGVTFVDDENVWVDASVVMGEDVVVEPMVRLQGATRIGANVRLGQGSVLVDTVVGDGVVIKPYSVCEQATVGARSVVGPFTRLRPDAVLDEDAHVGNFVELKKTKLGKGSKANHLAYLGDAVIGAGVNVGAGTITCNYDGVAKHQTTLDDGVFVGSNSTLVAPLHVHERAYVAAGSVITDEVEADALAFGRAKQHNKAGYAAQLRQRQQAAKGKT